MKQSAGPASAGGGTRLKAAAKQDSQDAPGAGAGAGAGLDPQPPTQAMRLVVWVAGSDSSTLPSGRQARSQAPLVSRASSPAADTARGCSKPAAASAVEPSYSAPVECLRHAVEPSSLLSGQT
jgi:hypothetical protein